MRKVLIADASEQWRELLENTMAAFCQVRSCSDGLQALALLEEFCPDVLVMDPMLPEVDGLRILRGLKERQGGLRVLVTSRYLSDFMMAALESCRVDEVMMKPCAASDVADRVGDLLAMEEARAVRYRDPYDHITEMLVELSVPGGSRDLRLLRSGVLRLMEDPGQQLTKELYPAVAREFCTNGVNMEKAMRTAVVRAWNRRRDNVWRAYFPPAPNGQIPKPTAGQFLARLADIAHCARRRA